MQFTITKEALIKPLTYISGIAERKSTLPILSNILLETQDERLALTCNDSQSQATAFIYTEESTTPGSTTVCAKKFADICKNLPPNSTLKCGIKDNKLIIKSGRSRYQLSTLPASEFPVADEKDTTHEFKVPRCSLDKIIKATSHAMANQDARHVLNGLLLEASENTLKAIATDGHRLSTARAELACDDKTLLHAIVPRKAVAEIQRMFTGEGGEITLGFGPHSLTASNGDLIFNTRLIDGKYPDYQRVIPSDSEQEIKLPTDALRQTLARAMILSHETFKGVKISTAADLLTIESSNPNDDQAIETIKLEDSVETFTKGFQAQYVIEALAALESETASLEFCSKALLIEQDDQQHVVMEMKI